MKKIMLLILLVLLVNDVYSQQVTPANFNSSSKDDFAPTFTQGQRRMFITSERQGKSQKIYELFFINSTASPEIAMGDINDGTHNGAATFTPDGQTMYFSSFEHNTKTLGRTDIYVARKSNGKWLEIVNAGNIINSEYWDSQPSLSPDGRYLFFASNRPGGFGGIDVWYCERSGDSWSNPENAGALVNSPADEMAPTIALDNRTFSFSSNRTDGFGGFDIYFAQFKDNKFQLVRNAGNIINTSNNEFFFTAQPNTNKAYFSSDKNGNLDIYTIEPNPNKPNDVVFVTGKVLDIETKEIVKNAKVTMFDLTSRKKVMDVGIDDMENDFYVVLQQGNSYSLTATAPGYLFTSERFNVAANEVGKEIKKDLLLSKTGTRLLINFDYNSSTLTEESTHELDRVVDFMLAHPSVSVAFEGHTDNLGDPSYNKTLSLERANTVKAYVVKGGVEANRITTAGYGMERPLQEGSTDEIRAINRRVEMKLK